MFKYVSVFDLANEINKYNFRRVVLSTISTSMAELWSQLNRPVNYIERESATKNFGTTWKHLTSPNTNFVKCHTKCPTSSPYRHPVLLSFLHFSKKYWIQVCQQYSFFKISYSFLLLSRAWFFRDCISNIALVIFV